MKRHSLSFATRSPARSAALFGSLAACLTVTSVGAQNTLESCRKISDPAARFTCYDSIPLPPAGSPAAPPARSAVQPQAERGEVVADSAVASDFSGWRPNERIALSNGQIWQVVDGSTYATRPGARKAVVRRGLLGADFLDVEGVAVSPRVRRVK